MGKRKAGSARKAKTNALAGRKPVEEIRQAMQAPSAQAARGIANFSPPEVMSEQEKARLLAKEIVAEQAKRDAFEYLWGTGAGGARRSADKDYTLPIPKITIRRALNNLPARTLHSHLRSGKIKHRLNERKSVELHKTSCPPMLWEMYKRQ